MNGEDLKQFALLAEFSESDRDALIELLDERNLPDGKSAFREGTESEGMILAKRLRSRDPGAFSDSIGSRNRLASSISDIFSRSSSGERLSPSPRITTWKVR